MERAGDPRYVQRERVGDEVRITLGSDSGETIEALRRQKERFLEKFGREPGPEDPVFFDPDADEPRPIDMTKVGERMLEAAQAAGVELALIQAANEVGYLPTEANRHTFTAHELEAYEEAVLRYRAAARTSS